MTELAGIHDALKRQVALAQQNPTSPSSVEIEQLAKPGTPPKITVKVFATDVDEAAARAQQLYDRLVATYAGAATSAHDRAATRAATPWAPGPRVSRPRPVRRPRVTPVNGQGSAFFDGPVASVGSHSVPPLRSRCGY
jgi:hypothetical protein